MWFGTFVKAGGDDVEGNAELIAETLQVVGIGLVMGAYRRLARLLPRKVHADMQCFDGEVGDVNLGATGQKLEQQQRVLATRQADEDVVVLVDELIFSQRLVKSLPKSFADGHEPYFINTR